MKMLNKPVILAVFLFLCISSLGKAQPDTLLSSPYDVIYNHLYYLQEDSYAPEKAALSFDSSLESESAIDLAIKLKQILDGGGHYIYLNKLPDIEDYTDSLSGQKLYILFPSKLPEVFVVKKGDQWIYAPETESAIPALHKKTYPLGTDYLLELIPAEKSKKFLWLHTWQFLAILLLLAISAILFFLLKMILKPILRKIGKLSLHIDLEDNKLLNKTSRVLSLLLVFLMVNYILPVLQLPVKGTMFTKRAIEIIITVLIALLLLRVLDYILRYFRKVTDKTDSKMDDQLMPIVSQLARLVVIIGTIVQILNLMEINVTALIAGISIGGLALALAAKDTVGNLIGSLMVFMDKPFQIGDYIEIGSMAGTVKEVGFRSTRIQTKDTSIISIPNGNIANTALINKGVRVFRMFETMLGVTYDTNPEKIEVFVEALKKMIIDHPGVTNTDYYIALNNLGPSSIDVFFRVYLNTNNYAEELEIREDLILKILKTSKEVGVDFAFPSTSVYIEKGS